MTITPLDVGAYDEPPPDENLPPQDLHAEQSVLGGMLLSKAACDDALEILRPENFYRPAHELIFDTIAAIHLAGNPADSITVADEMTKRGTLQRAGGQSYLHDLIQAVPTAANAGYYAEIVAEKATLRRLVEAGTRIVSFGRGQGEGGVADMVERARAEVDTVAEATHRGRETSIAQDVYAALEDLEHERTGIPTPWIDLTEALGGFRPGSVYVVGARPGRGKTLVGVGIALDAARRGHHAHIASLEMSKTELYHRMLASVGSVDMGRMLHHRLTADDWQDLSVAAGHIAKLPITVDDNAGQRVIDIRAKARSLSRTTKLGVIVVDYLQLMSSGGKVESRQVEVSAFSRGLKLLARELEVPVIVLSQLNRNPESRSDKRPTMADLRESGAVEQDADCVILLHRDEDKTPDLLHLNIEKHRHGRNNLTVELKWQAQFARLGDNRQTWVPERHR